MKNLFVFTLVSLITCFLFVSCGQEISEEEFNKEIITKTNTPLVTQKTINFIKYHDQYDEDSLFAVSIGHKAEFFFISWNNENAQEMLNLIVNSEKSKLPLKIFLAENEIINVESPSKEELTTFEESILLLPNTQQIVSNSRSSYSKRFFSFSQVQEVFDYMKAQDCNNYYADTNPCIPFQYKRDGCYARAHKMKEVMENVFRRSCDKIFVWGKLRNGCTFYRRWYYHVAPVVYVGSRQYIIDPGLNKNGPVSIAEWKNAMLPNDDYYIDEYKTTIKSGAYYMPKDQYNSSYGYYTEYNVSGINNHMNDKLRRHANLGTCDFD